MLEICYSRCPIEKAASSTAHIMCLLSQTNNSNEIESDVSKMHKLHLKDVISLQTESEPEFDTSVSVSQYISIYIYLNNFEDIPLYCVNLFCILLHLL